MLRRHCLRQLSLSSLWRRRHSTFAAAPTNAFDSDRVFAALREFRSRHGHALVPPRFVVPATNHTDHNWPSELHGLKLGSALLRLYDIAQRPGRDAINEELRAVGSQAHSNAEAYKAFYWQATVLAALQTYKTLHGDLYVPRSFVVPTDSDAGSAWPLAASGLRLGHQVHLLRKKAADDDGIPDYQRDALDALDFAWDVMEHKWETRFWPALTRFYYLHGHSNVPQKFIVSSTNEDWSDLPQCHRYRLGSAVNKVRRGDSFTAQIVRYFRDLEALGFTFSSFDRNWNAKVLPALETFYEVYGHSHVDAYFEVPENDAKWPRITWGMGLGFIVQNIRSRGDFFPQIMRDGDRLDAIEFVWNRAEVKWKRMVLPALETFVAIHNHAHVPKSFVVPQEAPWPRDAYDLRLGRIVAMPSARTRFANYIEIDRKRLEQIGFQWSVMMETNRGSDGNEDDEERYDAESSDSEDEH